MKFIDDEIAAGAPLSEIVVGLAFLVGIGVVLHNLD